jgi:hypothetical protein
MHRQCDLSGIIQGVVRRWTMILLRSFETSYDGRRLLQSRPGPVERAAGVAASTKADSLSKRPSRTKLVKCIKTNSCRLVLDFIGESEASATRISTAQGLLHRQRRTFDVVKGKLESVTVLESTGLERLKNRRLVDCGGILTL